MSENENSHSADVSAIKFILHEQLQDLTEKFVSLCREDANDYKEMKGQIVTLIEEFCTSVDVNKLIVSLCFNSKI